MEVSVIKDGFIKSPLFLDIDSDKVLLITANFKRFK